MAKEVLVIPVFTITSKFAFLTSDRTMNSYRSSLSPRTIEALVCSQNWLSSTQAPTDLKKLLDDVEKYEEIVQGNLSIA